MIDQAIAFMGGLDLCFGRWLSRSLFCMSSIPDNWVVCRWDTPQHVLVDDPDPEEGTEHIWPGKYFSPESAT